MSQRALKKRELNLHRQEKETHQIYRKQSSLITQKSKYTQRNVTNNVSSKYLAIKKDQSDNQHVPNVCVTKHSSTPNLATINEVDEFIDRTELVRSHSESDLTKIPDAKVLLHAKSEFHLQSIQSTQVSHATSQQNLRKMFPSVHNVRLAVESSCVDSSTNIQSNFKSTKLTMPKSMCHSSMTTSTSNSSISSSIQSSDMENIRIPIIGYEVMEERARFTVHLFNYNISIYFVNYFHNLYIFPYCMIFSYCHSGV